MIAWCEVHEVLGVIIGGRAIDMVYLYEITTCSGVGDAVEGDDLMV
jgi:hypothetical protein